MADRLFAVTGGSIRFPDWNMLLYPPTADPGISEAGNRGYLMQSFGANTTPIVRFNTDCCLSFEMEINHDTTGEGGYTFQVAGTATASTRWALEFYGRQFGTLRLRRRFKMSVVQTGTNGIFYSRQVPIHWRKIMLNLHRNGNIWRADVYNTVTGEMLVGTGTDDAAFLAELSSSDTGGGLSAHPSGTSMFAIGGIVAANNLNVTKTSQPSGTGFWPFSIGKCFYATQVVTDANIASLAAGNHIASVLTVANIKWYRAFSMNPAALLADPLCTSDTTAATQTVGNISAGSHISLPFTTDYATIDSFTRGRKIFGLRKGQGARNAPFSGRCAVSQDSMVQVRLRHADGVTVIDWTDVAAIQSDATAWSGILSVPKQAKWLIAEARIREKTPIWVHGARFAAGYVIPIMGQSQVANGFGTTGNQLQLQYKGPPFNLATNVGSTTEYKFASCNPQGQAFGADMYKAAAMQLAEYGIDAPFELAPIGIGGTGPEDMLENFVQDKTGMLTQAWQVADLCGGPEGDVSGVVNCWHSDPSSNGGLWGVKVEEGYWRGRGQYTYSATTDPIFTASIRDTTMTVTDMFSGVITNGQTLATTGTSELIGGTTVVSQLTSTEPDASLGKRGTYQVSATQLVFRSEFRISAGLPAAPRWIMQRYAVGTPIFAMPMVGGDIAGATLLDYDGYPQGGTEGTLSGGYGMARDSQINYYLSRGLPMGSIAIDVKQVDIYHPLLSDDKGTARFGRHIATTIAACLGFINIKNPTVNATSGVFTDGTRAAFTFRVNLFNEGRLVNGDGTGDVTQCIQLSKDGGATWSASKHTALITGGDTVTVTITDATYKIAGLRFQVNKGGPYAHAKGDTAAIAARNIAIVDKMLYEGVTLMTNSPGLPVSPSQTQYVVAG